MNGAGVNGAVANTIPGLLIDAVGRGPDAIAVVDGDERVTYGELAERVRSFGAALIERGVEAGDRVAIWAPNSVRWIVAMFGASSAGATIVPVNTRFKGDEAAAILRRSGARVLVTVSEFLGADYVAMLRAGDPGLEIDTIVDELPAGASSSLAELDARATAVAPTDPSDILFTSGTTGVAKGVVQTHAGTTCVARDWVAMTGITADDRYLMVNPYFHMFGFKAGILASVAAGLTMYPVAVFDAGAVLDTVERERITVLPGAPTLYRSLLDTPGAGERDLSSLRIAVTGAADIPVPLIERVMHELPFETVLAGYGLSEGGTATATEPGDPPDAIATTVGKARPGFELRIDGADTGEILLRGPSIMSHYLDDPEATAAALSEDGWLRTGDIGTVGDDGRLRIVGRSKDMFIVAGFNAYPAEIENALLRCPGVDQVAVIGIPDDRMGEVGMAFVVGDARPDDVMAWAREHMANYKVPRRVEVLDSLPINAAGKVEKLVLREMIS